MMPNYLPLILLALAGCVETAATVAPQAAATPATQTVSTSGFGAALNSQRTANGRAALTADSRLAAAAQTQADDMAANAFFSHTGSDGSTLRQRVLAQGYGNCFVAENIASGQTSEAAVLTTWMNSPAHRANILNPQSRSYGLGQNGRLWVLVLGGC